MKVAHVFGTHILSIALNVPLYQTFAYQFGKPLAVGTRVLVPFGHRQEVGIVWDSPTNKEEIDQLKSIITVFDELPPLPSEIIALIRFCSHYYHHPIGQVALSILPALLRKKAAVDLTNENPWVLTKEGQTAASPSQRKKAQYALWERLNSSQPLLKEEARIISQQASKILSCWQTSGWIEQIENHLPFLVCGEPTLNAEQTIAVNAVSLHKYQTYLLHGITGSGKTEVYLSLMKKVLLEEGQVLFLVPEISLTPQLITRFKARFPNTPFVALHSQLSDKVRLKGWYEAALGKAKVVIGARLSVFTPLPNLGLIIVDEEHDASFKQQDEMRYHAKDLAIWRACQKNIPIVLGSATPSLESIANLHKSVKLTLKNRAYSQATLPTIHLINIQKIPLKEGLSPLVIQSLKKTLDQHQQSLVFINRRGFSPVLYCKSCSWISQCKHCSAKLVLHNDKRLRCHLCGYSQTTTIACPDCGDPDLQGLGQGTQRIEEALRNLFPKARILRVDKDTMHPKKWNDLYEQVNDQKVDILVGTQMLAKGHDFGNIATVVVLNADSGLYSSDFRSGERLFSQLVQVAGRAGRAKIPGEVFIQTAWPDHPLYQSVVANNIEAFLDQELKDRKIAGFPPTTYQALLRADAKNRVSAVDFLRHIQKSIVCPSPLRQYGPVEAMTSKMKGRERAQLLIESPTRQALHRLLKNWLPHVHKIHKSHRQVRWSIDVDPQDF